MTFCSGAEDMNLSRDRDAATLCSGAASEMDNLRRLLSSSLTEKRVDATQTFRSSAMHSAAIDNGGGAVVVQPRHEGSAETTLSLSDRMFASNTNGVLPSRRRSSSFSSPTARRKSHGGGGFPMPRLHRNIPNPFKDCSSFTEMSSNNVFESVQLALKLARGGSFDDSNSLIALETDDSGSKSTKQAPKFSSFPMPKLEPSFAKSLKLGKRTRKPYSFKTYEREWMSIQTKAPSPSLGDHDDWNMTRHLFLRKALRRKFQLDRKL